MQPFEMSDEYYTALGKMTVAWNSVEIPLEFITGVLFVHFDGRRFAKRLPRTLDRKIEFCRKCVGSAPALEAFRDGMFQILDRTEELSDARHHLIHGLVDNLTPVPEGVIIIRKLIHEQAEHRFSERRTSLADIAQLTDEMIALGAAGNQAVEWIGKHAGILDEDFRWEGDHP
jgi:hypothetical protein